MTQFRINYVWQNEVNKLLGNNMEGVMEIFNKYMISDTIGFNLESGINVLREAGVVL